MQTSLIEYEHWIGWMLEQWTEIDWSWSGAWYIAAHDKICSVIRRDESNRTLNQWMFLVPLQCGSCRCRCHGSGSPWWTAMSCGSCSVIVSAGCSLTLCRRLTSPPGNVFTSTTSSRWREPSLHRCAAYVSSSVGPSTVPGGYVWHQWDQGTINIEGRSMLCIVDGPHRSTTCVDAAYCR